ncbi:hypothetical protein PAECIP111893_03841 [Paenibacillus plantiphilus]|uniref:Immunity protein 22 n=1 Tax=Paenibacillus plantiphilus TaxID=2905650 RepID=A0ABM9CKS3_9BACL|nr:hypothetical protein [Paenibacillus plantiphilus]CAH1214738.1 hypothetical protein PAECIP111893_03841 [Paenibacillus plantiphilus]
MELKDIFFFGLKEPEVNSLSMYFSKSEEGDPEFLIIGEKFFGDSYPINVDENSPLIQIDFQTYVAYSIRNESFTSWDDYEEFEGKIFRIYKKSRYLDFISVGTFASEDFPGTFQHYGICCLDHIIDVVSVSKPVVSEIIRC